MDLPDALLELPREPSKEETKTKELAHPRPPKELSIHRPSAISPPNQGLTRSYLLKCLPWLPTASGILLKFLGLSSRGTGHMGPGVSQT